MGYAIFITDSRLADFLALLAIQENVSFVRNVTATRYTPDKGNYLGTMAAIVNADAFFSYFVSLTVHSLIIFGYFFYVSLFLYSWSTLKRYFLGTETSMKEDSLGTG